MKVLVIDPRLAGASGDMFLAALVDMVGEKYLLEFVEKINGYFKSEMSITVNKIKKKGMASTYLGIEINQDLKYHHVTDLNRELEGFLDYLSLSNKAKEKVKETFNYLFRAESIVHNTPIESLHLHETASIDTFLDIVGFFYLLEKHDFLDLSILGLPANVGKGFVTFSHGTVAVPPPAVAEIMSSSSYMMFSDGTEGELVTPTGAAILAAIVTKKINQLPPLKIEKISRGAGTKDLEKRANVLTIFLADIPEETTKHYLTMLETHLDDISGEIMGGIMPTLLEKGALDVSYYPLIMKKNRPGWSLRILCDQEKASELAYYVMRELGTLGVRESRFARYELNRRVNIKNVKIKGKEYKCRYKERLINGEIIGAKPEFEDMLMISKDTETPLVELEKELIHQYQRSE
ncbi:MAG: nickel pincer cofactor biosynthesis protein LarC [Candidatus Heimdallarchaeaceae archaeon]